MESKGGVSKTGFVGMKPVSVLNKHGLLAVFWDGHMKTLVKFDCSYCRRGAKLTISDLISTSVHSGCIALFLRAKPHLHFHRLSYTFLSCISLRRWRSLIN